MEKFGIKNHITIPGFAIVELGLSGNELVCFSLIYGFCQDGESEFFGSINYMVSALNIDRSNVIRILNKLTTKGIIVKRVETINNVKHCHYTISKEVVAKCNYQSQNNTTGSRKMQQGVVVKCDGGSRKITPNNIIYNNNDNIINNTADSPLNARFIKFEKWMDDNCPEVQKMKYPITQAQFGKLIEQYSVKLITDRLSDMNNWAQLRKRNVSAYQTLINWIQRDEKRNDERNSAGRSADATLGTNFRPSDI